MIKKSYLHIEMDKTGTTTLQYGLKKITTICINMVGYTQKPAGTSKRALFTIMLFLNFLKDMWIPIINLNFLMHGTNGRN
jgi:hypothetical protein